MKSDSIRRGGRDKRRRDVAVLLVVLLWIGAWSTSARADAVTDWDVIAFDAVDASGMTGPVTALPITMAHVAMHDALNAINRRYEPYAYDAVGPRGASPEAAVGAAAYGVLVAEIPSQKPRLDAALGSSLARISDGKAKTEGVAVGQAAAAAILARRANDGSKVIASNTPGKGIGVWVPTPPRYLAAVGAGFGQVEPFTMTSSEQFLPPRPAYFNLKSAEYAANFNEVKAIGGADSKTRTAEQSEIARFWYEPSPGVHIRLARELVTSQKLNLWDSARLFALLHLIGADSLIAGYDAKYRYNFWRPVTAIPNGDGDGNPQTVGDPEWRSYLETPNHPDYLSLHAVLCAAWAEALARFFGTDHFNFTMESAKPFPGIKRSFTSFSQSAQEAANSRVYGGVHFPSSCKDGLVVGREIGAHAYANFLRPVAVARATIATPDSTRAAPDRHP
jgi:hypothetical protein